MTVPQICGGLGPPGFETEKTSVKHLEASERSSPAAARLLVVVAASTRASVAV